MAVADVHSINYKKMQTVTRIQTVTRELPSRRKTVKYTRLSLGSYARWLGLVATSTNTAA